MSLSLTLSLALCPRPASGGGGGGSAPVMLVGGDPTITGSTTSGSTLQFFAPLYDVTPDQYELRITNGDGSTEYLPWTVVTSSYSNSAGAVGQTVVAHWRATKGGAPSVVNSSAPFGPIVPGETFIGAWAFNIVTQGLPSTPYPWTNVTVPGGSNITAEGLVYPLDNPNITTLKWGFAGTILNSASPITSVTTATDARARGRMAANVTMTQLAVRLDLPAGTFRIYGGFKVQSAAVNTQIEIRRDTATGTVLHTLGIAALNVGDVRDMAGNIYTGGTDAQNVAAWVAAGNTAAGMPGAHVEFTLASPTSIFVGKPAASGAPAFSCFGILQVA